MSWYLKKGDKVADTKAVSLPWYKTRDLSSDLSSEEIDIYCCASDKVPTYKDADTFRVCKLRADLSTIPKTKFEKKKSATPGRPDKYILNYNVEMTMDSASISFRMVIDG